jgi:hypothetical protein
VVNCEVQRIPKPLSLPSGADFREEQFPLIASLVRRSFPYLLFGASLFAASSEIPARPPSATCSVAALPAISDAEAQEFEKAAAPSVGGLKPAMARALEKFKQLVLTAGGTFELKSAYRPPAYQTHLQEVWYKWMTELRNNREPGCQAMRAEVGDEFARHHLLESQKPVTSSYHTRGLAFDASVILPKIARLSKRRVSLDRLARLAGIRRPDIFRDPVHFQLAGGRGGRRA